MNRHRSAICPAILRVTFPPEASTLRQVTAAKRLSVRHVICGRDPDTSTEQVPMNSDVARPDGSWLIMKVTVFVVVMATILVITALPWIIREAATYLASH